MARGYTGELRVLSPRWELSWTRLVAGMIGVGLVSLASGWLARGLS